MKLIVIGGNGLTGSLVVQQAAASGHEVTIFGRHRANPGQAPPAGFAPGDATDRAALTAAIRGHDLVVSTIGRGLSFKSEHLIERSVPQILAAMVDAGVRRLIFTSALGVGESRRDAPLPAKIFFSTLLRGIYADKLVGDELIRKSGLEWTIVQPAQMTNGPLTKRYRSGERLQLKRMPQISRADVAHFILACATDRSTIGKTLIIAN